MEGEEKGRRRGGEGREGWEGSSDVRQPRARSAARRPRSESERAASSQKNAPPPRK